MSFKEFKKSQDNLKAAAEQALQGESKSNKDERFWKYTLDASKCSNNLLRLLPQQATNKSPFVAVYSHFIKIGTKMMYENCATNIGEKCPICEHAFALKNSGQTEEAKQYYRKTNWLTNVLVVKDGGEPDNNGKVFIWKYPKTIQGLIDLQYNPVLESGTEFDPDTGEEIEKAPQVSSDPFNIFTGKNLILNLWTKEGKDGYLQYDKCKFSANSSEICKGNEEEQEAVYSQLHDLSEFTAKDKFKSYDEVLKRLTEFLSAGNIRGNIEDEMKQERSSSSSTPNALSEKIKESSVTPSNDSDEIDFDALLEDDILF